MNDNYTVLPLDEGVGKTYSGNGRFASWKWIMPGYTSVVLAEESTHVEGHVTQSEKADDVCRAWIEERRISSIVQFHTPLARGAFGAEPGLTNVKSKGLTRVKSKGERA